MSFDDLGLNNALTSTVTELGYTEPTPIQKRAIPVVIEGDDLLAAAQTGTGKTAAFALPIIQVMTELGPSRPRKPSALVLSPTRELAAQIAASLRSYTGKLPVRSAVVFGGVSAVGQIKALRQGVDVLIATPGRLLDHMQQGNVDLSDIEVFVLDEADRMLDMGFIPDIRRIIAKLPEERQNLLFSATFSPEIRKLAKTFLTDPVEIDVAPRNTAAKLVDQKVVYVNKDQKREFLSWKIGSANWKQVLVFARTKHGADRLSRQLDRDGLPSAALHGNKSQGARTRALADFKSGKLRVLVATDIAARGIDIDQLPHVINYELPNVSEDYVHRIGRTGRAGMQGEALALVSGEEIPLMRDIEKLIGRKVPELQVEDFHIKPVKAAEKPSKSGGKGRGRANGGAKPAGQNRRRSAKPNGGSRDGSREGSRKGSKAGGRPANGGSGKNGSNTGNGKPKRRPNSGKPSSGRQSERRASR